MEVFGFCDDPPLSNDPSSCTFNVESIQLGVGSNGTISILSTGGILTPIDPQAAPTNLLVDTSIGKLGPGTLGEGVVELGFICPGNDCTGPVEFNGEKPQGLFIICIALEADGTDGDRDGGPCFKTHSMSELPGVLEGAAVKTTGKTSAELGQKVRDAGSKLQQILCAKFPDATGCN